MVPNNQNRDLNLNFQASKCYQNLFLKKVEQSLIKHSENRIIIQSVMFENEIGPGVLQSSVRQTRVLQEYQRHKPRPADYVPILSMLCEMFGNFMFAEYLNGAL